MEGRLHTAVLFLLDAGSAPDRYSAGWMYDARRKRIYACSTSGAAWALRIEPTTAKLLERMERSYGGGVTDR